LNIDVDCAAAAITPRTKAILPVHYAGVGCDMDALMALAGEHGLAVLEDAAHAIGASWSGRPLGTFGSLGALSFHETKNATCGEGGALLINDPELVASAEILQEKGTNRSAFFRGEVDKYTWVDVGSSFVMSDINAAFLLAQLEHLDEINAARTAIWDRYMAGFEALEQGGLARRPIVPERADHNGHLFYLLLAEDVDREAAISACKASGVNPVFHYIPLHSSPAGERLGRVSGSLERTDRLSAAVMRLPLWVGMDDAVVDRVIATVSAAVADAATVPAR
ncbi:MAG: dTDP-4-amino-4,6-dideoxygalactose transaminase, partial [Solirubrobacterales bacterium]|nr:dTDP-4-amino-4,6-dideoxygalactose transaminase [Solirubrobacterales bacterium]